MDNILIMYCIYLAVYVLYVLYLLLILNKRKKSRTPISYIAKFDKPHNEIYKFATIFYGLFSLILPYLLFTQFKISQYVTYAIFLLTMVCILTVVTSIITVKDNEPVHEKIGGGMFVVVCLTAILFTFSYKFLGTEFIKISLLSLLMILSIIILVSKVIGNMKSRKYAPYEWIVFLLTIAWNILLSFTIMNAY